MSEHKPAENPFGTPTTSGPEPLLKRQQLVNSIVRTMLRVPGLSRLVGKRLLVLHVVGRKSGKVFDVPVAYTRHNGTILIGTALRPWVKNLRPGTPVTASLGGKPREFDPRVHTGELDVMRLYEVIAKDNPTNAKFNGIGFAEDGSPVKADIYQTWRLGGVVIELTPN
ncbi:nitroreductase/quinone reductase family protein [Nocardia sp. XZ_19_385]|uniref:nitroreductase/quinone reductase family protein n=1 Tax=Nocardia sp. XZ_19_385 TaxID=2769488 RepID=UPI00188DD2ED|nr:nitroreductase/quinone reductase family protein [Nocardia sp. XZ_19_385]